MLQLTFRIDTTKKNKKGFVPIIARMHYKYKAYSKIIGKTKIRYWNDVAKKVRPPKSDDPYNDYQEINDYIDKLKKKTEAFYRECHLNNEEITPEKIRLFLDGKINVDVITFNEAFQEFINDAKANKAKWTWKGYATVHKFLNDFQNNTGFKLDFNNLNVEMFDRLKEYAYQERKIETNYFAKITAVLKRFLNWSTLRKYYSGNEHRYFKATEKDKPVVFLTMDELMKLYRHEFESKKHDKARDIYCFMCFTGLRYSDTNQLLKAHIRGNLIIKRIEKTEREDHIPLNKYALEILKKYDGLPIIALPRISNQKLNSYIKECCQKAEINQPEEIVRYSGNQKIITYKPKYDVITAHTARKTYITNSLMLGMNTKTIMSNVGHTKDSTMNKYIKMVDKFKNDEMDNTWNKV